VSDGPDLEWDERSALILALMRVEAKLDELLRLWEDDDGEEEDADSWRSREGRRNPPRHSRRSAQPASSPRASRL